MDNDKIYRFCTVLFPLTGGDGYTPFTEELNQEGIESIEEIKESLDLLMVCKNEKFREEFFYFKK